MILVAYGCLVVVLTGFLIRGSSFHLPARYDLPARVAGMVGTTATAAVALLVISESHATALGRIAVLMLLVGSVLHLAGLALWHVRAGFIVRVIGWIIAVAALAIPSTLTLLLPLVALLALTLRPASEDQILASHPAR